MPLQKSVVLGLRTKRNGETMLIHHDITPRPLAEIQRGKFFSLPGKKAIYQKLWRPLRDEDGKRYLAISRLGKVVKRFRDTKSGRATIVRPRPDAHWPRLPKLVHRI